MALNMPFSGDSGNRIPIVKYDSRAGRAFRVDRTEQGGSWTSNNVEITNVFQAVFDMDNVETGWLHFPTGGAPDIRTVKDGQALPDRPTDKHRQGFRILLLLGRQAGGDVRELASNAKVSIQAMNDLDDAWKAGRAQNPGCLPVVRLAGTKPIPSQGKANGVAVSSVNYQPIWQIVKWVPRPPALEPAAIAQLMAAQPPPQQQTYAQQPAYQGAAAPQPQQQQQPALPLTPPPAAQQPQPMLASVDDDF